VAPRPRETHPSPIIALMIRILGLPILIAAVGAIYWWFSHEPAGSALLLIFAAAVAVFLWVLVPTSDNVGPTAPVDPDFEPKRR
jgi:uncharacterized membrane protein YccC